MRIFGRKANQQSSSIAGPEVPPELQPYYGRPSLGIRLRRIGLLVLPVIAVLALIVALVAGGMWLKQHSDENKPKVVTSQSTTQKPATNNSQQNGESANNSPSQPSGSQSSSSSTDNTNSANGSSLDTNSTSQQPVNSNTQASSTSNIPNTGPDSSIYLVALATAIVAAAASYMRQLKMIRR